MRPPLRFYAMAKNPISVLTLNVQGLRSSNHRASLFSWLSCVKADIVCLQETHSVSSDEFSSWVNAESVSGNNLFHYSSLSSPGSTRSSGVAILFSPSFKVENFSADNTGRLLVVTFSSLEVNSSHFQVATIYGPNRKQAGHDFFASLPSHCDPSFPLILCGDFNTVPDATLDRTGCNPSSPWAYGWPSSLKGFLSDFSLQDVWRDHHPGVREFTWHRPDGSQASRLDMFWLSSLLLHQVVDVAIYPFFRSDHSYVLLRLNLPSLPHRGPGVWKFNTHFLRDEDFNSTVCTFWESWKLQKSSFPSLAVWWDAGKNRLKHLVRQYSKRKARLRRSKVQSLENTLFHLRRRQTSGEDVTGFIKETKIDLELEYAHAAAGAKVRSREKWAEEGETSSSFFLRQEKSRARRKLFTGIRNAAGRVVCSVTAMLHVWCAFYIQLFSATLLNVKEQNFFLKALNFSLSDSDSGLCEGVVTEEECLRALNSFSNNKSPGIDGLPYEFYKHFWTLLGSDLVSVFNDCFSRGSLSYSQRTGLISLLFKKGDRLDTKNWRPISLLCTDYKILSKVLTNRLLLVLPSVVGFQQACGVPGRFSGENIRLLQDIIDYSNTEQVAAAILSLDQEKAFDRVDWAFLLRVLEAMKFGPSFRSWIRLLYTNIFSCVLVNDFKSSPFPITRGVRQGCPLSPLLYILVAETIACAIKQDHLISGFSLPDGQQVKVFQYADDTTIVVRSDAAMTSLFALFDRYESASGAKLNVRKSHGLLLGPWRNRSRLPVNLLWSSDSISVLGCALINEGSVDWTPLLDRFSQQLSLWKQRQLSFRGRALIANTLGLSLFWYQATIFHIPKSVINKINQLLFPFVWGKKREWLRRSSVCQPLSSGGLGVVDVVRKLASLRAGWLRRFFTLPAHPWTSFFHYFVFKIFSVRVEALLVQDSIPVYRVNKLPSFYASLLHLWVALQPSNASGQWLIPNPVGMDIEILKVSSKLIYQVLSAQQHVDHRALAKFRHWDIPVHWNNVWESLKLWRFVRSVQDTSWLSFHGILPTADRLARFQMRVDLFCFCGQTETLLHLFTDCPFAKAILDWFLLSFRLFDSKKVSLSLTEILFGFTGTSQRHVPVVFTALMGVIRHHIWLARNRRRFDCLLPTVEDTLHNIKSTFCFLVRIQKRHCSRSHFLKDWLAGGIVGSLTKEDWITYSNQFIK